MSPSDHNTILMVIKGSIYIAHTVCLSLFEELDKYSLLQSSPLSYLGAITDFIFLVKLGYLQRVTCPRSPNKQLAFIEHLPCGRN